jgi:hypothetical protein
MLIRFKSLAGSEVMMFADVARKLLHVMGKAPNVLPGAITVEQLPEAIARLKRAIDDPTAAAMPMPAHDDELAAAQEQPGRPHDEFVNLKQRALPLLELLQYSLRDEEPVIYE